jgi:hypothetical protein
MPRHCIPAAVAVIALALPSIGCGGAGPAARTIGHEAGAGASGARESAAEFNQIRKAACRRVKVHEYSNTLQGDDSADDYTGIC